MAPSQSFDYRVLRAWRLESGMKLEQACVLADVSYPYLRAIEHGQRQRPSIELLTRLAAVYDRDLRELFTGHHDAPAGAR
jgi:transcriptional regulator with XRE-family HTH domain